MHHAHHLPTIPNQRTARSTELGNDFPGTELSTDFHFWGHKIPLRELRYRMCFLMFWLVGGCHRKLSTWESLYLFGWTTLYFVRGSQSVWEVPALSPKSCAGTLSVVQQRKQTAAQRKKENTKNSTCCNRLAATDF